MSHSVFFDPISASSSYIKISADLGLASGPNKSTKKIVTRLITISAIIAAVTPLIIFYNTLSFSIKGSLAIASHLTHSKVFGYHHFEYLTAVNLHIAYAIKDLIVSLFLFPVSITYALNPEFAEEVDNLVNRVITYPCIRQAT